MRYDWLIVGALLVVVLLIGCSAGVGLYAAFGRPESSRRSLAWRASAQMRSKDSPRRRSRIVGTEEVRRSSARAA
jgi:cytochrome c-type biogenesis protein CcmH/NrfG